MLGGAAYGSCPGSHEGGLSGRPERPAGKRQMPYDDDRYGEQRKRRNELYRSLAAAARENGNAEAF